MYYSDIPTFTHSLIHSFKINHGKTNRIFRI